MYLRIASKMQKDSKQLKSFSNQLLDMARDEYFKKNINDDQYSRFVDLLTGLNLKTEEMNFELTSIVNDKNKRRRINNKSKIDIKA